MKNRTKKILKSTLWFNKIIYKFFFDVWSVCTFNFITLSTTVRRKHSFPKLKLIKNN